MILISQAAGGLWTGLGRATPSGGQALIRAQARQSEFVVGETAGRSELHGREVNLLHRLLKNDVTADTGVRAYAMFTQDAVQALDLGALTEGMTRHSGTYADVGTVVALSLIHI